MSTVIDVCVASIADFPSNDKNAKELFFMMFNWASSERCWRMSARVRKPCCLWRKEQENWSVVASAEKKNPKTRLHSSVFLKEDHSLDVGKSNTWHKYIYLLYYVWGCLWKMPRRGDSEKHSRVRAQYAQFLYPGFVSSFCAFSGPAELTETNVSHGRDLDCMYTSFSSITKNL